MISTIRASVWLVGAKLGKKIWLCDHGDNAQNEAVAGRIEDKREGTLYSVNQIPELTDELLQKSDTKVG